MFVVGQLKHHQAKWKACKKKSLEIHRAFLEETAEMMAIKMRTTHEKAIKEIIKSEESRRSFQNIKNLLDKQQIPLMQIDIRSNPRDQNSPQITLNKREEVETSIMTQNRIHSLQALKTPFMSDPSLHKASDSFSPNNQYNSILDGSYVDTYLPSSNVRFHP